MSLSAVSLGNCVFIESNSSNICVAVGILYHIVFYQLTCLSVRSKYGAKSSSGLDRKFVGSSKLFINAVTFGQ